MYSCSNNSTIAPFENEKEGCKENMDTLLSHLNGWKVINTYYDVDCFCSTTDKDGQRTDYQKYSLVARITDGLDTLTVVTDNSDSSFNSLTNENEKAWLGTVFGLVIASDLDVNIIKRNNLAIKRACENDSCFELTVNSSKILKGKFLKWKPKIPERPLEDYGLTDDDVNK